MSTLAVRYGESSTSKKQTESGSTPTETLTLLWENTTPTTNRGSFNADLSESVNADTFKKIRIVYHYSTSSTKDFISDTVFTDSALPDDYDADTSSAMSISLAVRVGGTYYSRAVRFTGTSYPYTRIYFGGCTNTSGATRNQNCIPIRIYGIN